MKNNKIDTQTSQPLGVDKALLKEVVATNKAVNENASRLVTAIDLLVKEMASVRKAVSMYEVQGAILKDKIQESEKVLEKLRSELDQITYSKGFYAGRKYIVTTAENIMMKHFGCRSREELSTSDKMPAFWIATLVMCLDDPPLVLDITELQPDEGNKHERKTDRSRSPT